MSTYSASNLLEYFNTYAGRPSTGDIITDATKYGLLARAQDVVIEDFSSRIPQPYYTHVAYGSLPTLSTTDNQVFIFSSSDVNGDATFPIGKMSIYDSLQSYPDNPLTEGTDYIWEGTQIRIPDNRTWSGSTPLYYRGVVAAEVISSSGTTITVMPPPARVLIVYEAVRQFATQQIRNPELAQAMASEYGLSFARWCLTLKAASVNRGSGSISGLKLAMSRG